MAFPLVYADFQNLDNHNRLKLTCWGTQDDLSRLGIQLQEGLMLTFYMDDGDDEGNLDELMADGIVSFSQEDQCWVASIDWSAIRHASDDGVRGFSATKVSTEAAVAPSLQPSPKRTAKVD